MQSLICALHLHIAVQFKAWGVSCWGNLALQVLQWEGIVGFVGVTVIVGGPVSL